LLVKKSGKVLTYNATSWWNKVSLKVEAGDSILFWVMSIPRIFKLHQVLLK